MSICTDYLEVAAGREALYRFLARIYRVETTVELLESMKGLAFPASEEAGAFSEGIAELEAFLRKPGLDPRTDLAVDYARVFLGAGIADGCAAFPYESVYTSPEHLMMQDARDEVMALYLAHGLGIEGETHDPEDHLAFELDFMAHLIAEGASAADGGNSEGVVASVAEQQAFLREHLLNWIGRFCDDVEKYSQTAFYQAAAKMTMGFTAMDDEVLAELTAVREGE